MFSIWQWALIIIAFGPVIHVWISERSHGGAKFGWLLAVLFFPILGYIFFLIVTQPQKDRDAARP